jgi:hypothetical protein
MKRIGLFLTMMLGVSIFAFAQTFPQGMNYQAVMRDLDGQVLADQEMNIKITLLGGDVQGKEIYSEVHQVNSNQIGLINLVIGRGDVIKGDMLDVPWASEEIWMDIAIGNDDKVYNSISTTRLLAVPYAFHALSADRVGTLEGSEKVTSPYWKTLGNSGVTAYNFLGTVDYKNLVFKTDNTPRMTILAGGGVTIAQELEVEGDVNAGAFIGDGSGLSGIDVRDADHDPTNELQKWSNLPGIPSDIFDGDDVNDADADPTNELQSWHTLPGIPAYLLDGDQVEDADADPTNELQRWNTLPGIPSDIFDGDDVNDADADPTNELQTWTTLPGIPLDIFDGDHVNDADADPTNELELPPGGAPGQVLSISPTGQYYWRDIDPVYTIGYNAELGGYVFYVTPDGKHGLVAATQDQGYVTWHEAFDVISKPANHNVIAKNFTDWRLPTKYELDLMFDYRNQIGGGMDSNYWCGIDRNYDQAWYQNFYFGYTGYTYKSTKYDVRAIRDF